MCTGERNAMTAIVESIDISRRPEDVFAYAADPVHFPEWEEGAVSAHREGDARLAVGAKTVVVRRVGPRKLSVVEEVVELDPPRSWAVRGVSGLMVAIARGTIAPLDDGRRSRVTIAFDLEGHGIGRMLARLVVRPRVKRTLPREQRKLKQVLEGSADWHRVDSRPEP
jgi:uncharacterized protein YndB with AHSA1/START domain